MKICIVRTHQCGVLAAGAGPGGEEVPSVFIDRTGVKLSVQEQYSRNSKGTLSLVVEQVARARPPSRPLGPLLS